jgi:hypothetical protein
MYSSLAPREARPGEVCRGHHRPPTDLLAELSEGRVGEERHVAEQLVADVRLRRVVGAGVVPGAAGGQAGPGEPTGCTAWSGTP